MTQAHYQIAADLSKDGRYILLDLTGGGPLTRYDQQVITSKLRALTPTPKQDERIGAVMYPATWPSLVQIEDTFGKALVLRPELEAWKQDTLMTQVMALGNKLEAPIPEGFTPYPWQVAGACQIGHLGKMMLNDDPGTGKTLTTILGLRERDLLKGDAFPAVVVVPASMVDTWVRTFEWLDEGRVAVAWKGTPKKRQALAGTADVYVTSYETARIDLDYLVRLKPRSVVLDEVHKIKNGQSKASKACRKLASKANVVVALSGTPISHGPHDLWPALNAMDSLSFPSRDRWVNRYCLVERGWYKDEVLGLDEQTEPEFRRSMAGQMRRVAKEDVLKDLPPKVYTTRYVELPTSQRKAYNDLSKKMIAELPCGDELTVMETLALYTRLAQLASASADVTTQEDLDKDGNPVMRLDVTLKAPSWKVDALLDIMEERPGEPVVCFSPSRQLVNLAGESAKEKGYRVGYVVGGQGAQRQKDVDAFQAGELDLLCVTTQAGGVGLTLTRSSTAVFLSRPWSYIESSQAEDRLHRIGSSGSSVEIIDVVASDTIDQYVRETLQSRAEQWSALAEDPRLLLDALGKEKVK